jgi:hypothetical protein
LNGSSFEPFAAREYAGGSSLEIALRIMSRCSPVLRLISRIDRPLLVCVAAVVPAVAGLFGLSEGTAPRILVLLIGLSNAAEAVRENRWLAGYSCDGANRDRTVDLVLAKRHG